MTPAIRQADQELLHKLLLGQLPSAEAERLTAEYADDSRLAELAEALAGKEDTLLTLLRNHETVVDTEAEKLVERLLQRLQLSPSTPLRDDTAQLSLPYEPSTAGSQVEVPGAESMPDKLEHYRLLKVLGQGGMGTVYLAEDTRLCREVALKKLRTELAAKPTARDRFLREARLAASIEHDNIVHIYHVGEDRGIPFLAMQLLKGTSLEDLLQRSGTLKTKQILRIGMQVAEGLVAAHARGMIHRDIKPGNIWIEPTGGGRVKLLDFGLARISTGEIGITQSGTVLGTPAYMPPEQARGGKVDHRCDLYSLGCVLYRMVTGDLPLKGSDTMSMLMALAVNEPTPPIKVKPETPQALSDLIMKLLAKDPNQRVGSARDVVQALKAIDRCDSAPASNDTAVLSASMPQSLSATPTAVDATLAPEPAAPSRQTAPRRRRLAVLAAVGLLALIGVGVLFGGQIFRVVTNRGELVIEVDDPAVEVKIVQNGVVVQDLTSKRNFTLTAGKGEIEVLEKDGIKLATKQFELTRGGKTTVKVTLQELADARKPKDTAAGPDRRAAEWVLSLGGTLSIKENGKERELKAVGNLPPRAFELTRVELNNNQKVSDAGLAHFKDCKNLMALALAGTQVSDAGLAHFKDCKNLTDLDLASPQVSDAGLAHFKDCKNLTGLALTGTQVSDAGLAYLKDCKDLSIVFLSTTKVSDAGLAHFKDCKNLITLDLGATKVSDAGLAHFKDRKNLTYLVLYGTQVSDAGLAYFKDCKHLSMVSLSNTKVSDVGLVHFKDCKNLFQLQLNDTQVSDAGLERLADFSKLASLFVKNTKVTAAGVKKLSAALPGCKIEWDGGVIEPMVVADPDRRAAEWVLSIGGSVRFRVNEKERHIGDVGDLPRGTFVLMNVVLGFNPKVSDAGLAHLKDCKNLSWITLAGTGVDGTGLAHFKDCENLAFLYLQNTRVTDAGLVHLKECKNLTALSLSATQVTDAGLVHLKECKSLTSLVLTRTKVTAAGVKKLATDLPRCKIEWDSGMIEPNVVANADRRAAEWVLSIGGTISIKDNGPESDIKAVADLPLGPFKLTGVDLDGNNKVSLAGLANFKGCKNLTVLNLNNNSTISDAALVNFKECKSLMVLHLGHTEVGDAGLAHLKDCKDLTILNLSRTHVSNAGLAYFKDCKNLTHLGLSNTSVSDAGLAHFKDCKNFTHLDLNYTRVTDAGLAHFKDCKNLESLSLAFAQVSEAGLALFKDCKNLSRLHLSNLPLTGAWLAHFKGCKNLTHLTLHDTPVSDADLAQFKDCKELVQLHLNDTLVTDTALERLADFPKLTSLFVKNTKVTAAGVKKLATDLPRCRIEWDGGVIEPKVAADPDRRAAEWVLSVGSTIRIKESGREHEIKPAGDLPRGGFELTVVLLHGKKVSDAGLAHFKDCKNLTELALTHTTEVTDAGLAHFKDCKNLTYLDLNHTGFSDVGLAHFKDCKNLTRLDLSYTKLSDAGLAHFKDCKNLTGLALSGTTLSDAGLAHFKDCKNLTFLYLTGTLVSDAGLQHLPGLKELENLNLEKTKVTAAGVAELQKALPKCQIEWDRGKDR